MGWQLTPGLIVQHQFRYWNFRCFNCHLCILLFHSCKLHGARVCSCAIYQLCQFSQQIHYGCSVSEQKEEPIYGNLLNCQSYFFHTHKLETHLNRSVLSNVWESMLLSLEYFCSAKLQWITVCYPHASPF